jgi:predicted transcriptional regulator
LPGEIWRRVENRLKPYCMTVVKYVLPPMRALIMNELIEKYGLRKVEIAKGMSVSPAAITQYQKGLRGGSFIDEVSESAEVMEIISDISEKIAAGDVPPNYLMAKMCDACKKIRNEGILCELHGEEFQDPSLNDCEFCFDEE